MAQKFKETAHLHIDLEKYGEGYDRIFGKKDSAENESQSIRKSLEAEVEENFRIKNLARHSYRGNSPETGSEGFPESSSYVFGFMEGYKAARRGE
jgi:hypothetical protein